MLVPVYEGCACGETYHVSQVEDTDDDGDEITVLQCNICTRRVTHPKTINGIQVVHELTPEELEDADDYPLDGEL